MRIKLIIHSLALITALLLTYLVILLQNLILRTN